MRIVQLLPTLSFGDAIGNDTIALSGALKDMGFKSEIYAENMELLTPRRVQERSGEQSAPGASTADTVNDGVVR